LNRINYGVCGCGKWGIAPKEFNERIHFLKCSSCGNAMYLDHNNPKEAGYNDRNKIDNIGTMKQFG